MPSSDGPKQFICSRYLRGSCSSFSYNNSFFTMGVEKFSGVNYLPKYVQCGKIYFLKSAIKVIHGRDNHMLQRNTNEFRCKLIIPS